jgi:hypothetical protein
MSLSTPNDDEDEDGQSTEEETTAADRRRAAREAEREAEQMRGPEAAAKRDVEEAERKAEGAHERAEEVHAELAAEIEEVQDQVAKLDLLVNAVYRMGATRDGEPPLNDEMPHVVPENQEDGREMPSGDQEASSESDGEGNGVPLPWAGESDE